MARNITASFGVAHYLPDAPTSEELIRRADIALYRAKESGRNCVREWSERPPSVRFVPAF